jgi:transglutaminase-like putative cysteine protease
MILNAQCHLQFHAAAHIPAIMMLRPRSGWGQWVMKEEYQLDPQVPVIEYTDGFANVCQRIVVPPGPFSVRALCTVHTPDTVDIDYGAAFVPIQNLAEAVVQFLLPSRYCQSDQFYAIASDLTAGQTDGYAQVEAIRSWIETNIQYRRGMSNASTSAMETYQARAGVCRDFAHLGISLCRALNIPARIVGGYALSLDEQDLHAWFEAYVGNRWFTFDATEKQTTGNRITLAYGRDAADVALVTQFGPLALAGMTVSVAPAAG